MSRRSAVFLSGCWTLLFGKSAQWLTKSYDILLWLLLLFQVFTGCLEQNALKPTDPSSRATGVRSILAEFWASQILLLLLIWF